MIACNNGKCIQYHAIFYQYNTLSLLENVILQPTSCFDTCGHWDMTLFTFIEPNLQISQIGLDTCKWGHVLMTIHVKWGLCSRPLVVSFFSLERALLSQAKFLLAQSSSIIHTLRRQSFFDNQFQTPMLERHIPHPHYLTLRGGNMFTDMCNQVAFLNKLPLYPLQIPLGQNHITKTINFVHSSI